MKHVTLRRQLIETARRMNALGINQGTSGNLSARIKGGLLVTPSGVAYDALKLSCGPVIPISHWNAVPPGKICSSAVVTWVCVPNTELTRPSR